MKNLVIVESPAKAKTITKYLGSNFIVTSSMGHIRDLPKKKTELLVEQQKLPYATLGIDVENNFAPLYVVTTDKKKIATELRQLAKKSDKVWLATDEDREGEAIAWHLCKVLKLDPKKTSRITFHEITKEAFMKAIENPTTLDINRINSQQARRVLDRLVGYELSPLLWKKIRYGLSAGRVQSVAVRIIVDRERERENFQSEEYGGVTAQTETPRNDKLEMRLAKIDSQKINDIKSRVEGETKRDIRNKLDLPTAQSLAKELTEKELTVIKVEQKERKSNPPAPYTTATLQRDASTRLGFPVQKTMRTAQKLYEAGYITYMRTDSVTLSQQAIKQARAVIDKEFGKKFLSKKSRQYKSKSKGAQEAHEAIRPTDFNKKPDSFKLGNDEARLYKLIWQRALATQMASAILAQTVVESETNCRLQRSGFKRAILLHAWDSDPEAVFFPWLKKELEKKGLEVVIPKLPNAKNPDFTEWLTKLKKLKPNENDIILGRSLGGSLALLAASHGIKFGHLISVCTPQTNLEISRFFKDGGDFDFDQIRKNTSKITIFHADDDPYVPSAQAEFFAQGCKVKINWVEKAGHFAGKKYPEILAVIPASKGDQKSTIDCQFVANGVSIKFPGFTSVYPVKTEENILPAVTEKEILPIKKITAESKETSPLPRYTEAALVKKMEQEGIGRPSTYAPTIATIITRGYIERLENKQLTPTDTAFVVTDLLKEHFENIVDLQFTARMEEELDEIAEGKREWVKMIRDFYGPFHKLIEEKDKSIRKEDVTNLGSTDEKCPDCGLPLQIKLGKFGKFLSCTGFPVCKFGKPLEGGEQKKPEVSDEKCAKCGSDLLIKIGRYGKFLACSNYPTCKNTKPIVKGTGVDCIHCRKGEIVEKRSRYGKIFYACDQYPDCKSAYWQKPTGKICKTCGDLMVIQKRGEVCGNMECPTRRKKKRKGKSKK